MFLSPVVLSLALAGALAACSRPAEVPLEPNPMAEAAKPVDHPREVLSSLPVQPSEPSGGSICSLESLEAAVPTEVHADGSMTVTLPASASGWAFPPPELPKPADAWLRLLPHEPGREPREFPLLINIERPDVTKAIGAAAGSFSGFAEVVIHGLPAGTYDSQIVFVTAGARVTCSNARRLNVR